MTVGVCGYHHEFDWFDEDHYIVTGYGRNQSDQRTRNSIAII